MLALKQESKTVRNYALLGSYIVKKTRWELSSQSNNFLIGIDAKKKHTKQKTPVIIDSNEKGVCHH